jgi:hypothetical protein
MMNSIEMLLEQTFCHVRAIKCTHLACEYLPNLGPFNGYPSWPIVPKLACKRKPDSYIKDI